MRRPIAINAHAATRKTLLTYMELMATSLHLIYFTILYETY